MNKRIGIIVAAIAFAGITALAMEGGRAGRQKQQTASSEKVICYGDTNYISGGSFQNLPDVEEIIFDGFVGHIDGYTITNCPKLKRVIFRGPVNSTGGARFVKDCPELEEVRFDGLVFATGFGAPINCPKLKGYTQNGIVLNGDSTFFRIGSTKDVLADKKMMEQAKEILDYKARQLRNPSEKFLENIEIMYFDHSMKFAEELGDKSFSEEFESVVAPVKADMEKTKLQLLKESPAYKKDDVAFEWRYAMPSDSILRLDREHYNLDSIAGNGDDISRIKNLMYWVHELVRHDGSSNNPQSISLIDVDSICRADKRGVNCRMMAIILTEALLAEGIPARYLTCQPKLWNFDSDCHVITIAWSDSLGKWVWVDPTFAAFVTDENGVMLHPGEVRERLIADKPLILNPDANWNHESPQTKEDYLDNYMAKNLYYISAREFNCPRPEGIDSRRSNSILLQPEGATKTPWSDIYTTDSERFWAAPVKK